MIVLYEKCDGNDNLAEMEVGWKRNGKGNEAREG